MLNAWEKKRGIEQRKKSAKRYRTLFDNASDAIIVHDFNNAILDVNRAAVNLLGYARDELSGMSVDDIFCPQSRNSIRDRIKNIELSESSLYESEFVTKKGAIIPIETGIRQIEFEDRPAVLTIARDIRERKRAETRQKEFETYSQQVRKLEAIGTLASGIAHDFNNILSIMIGNVELAIDDVGDKDMVMPRLEETKTMIFRAKDLIRQILRFSRQDAEERLPLELRHVIKEVLVFFRSTLPANIEIRESIGECGNVFADTAQIHQVMMNLFANAYHAMRETGGILDVRLRETPNSDTDEALFAEITVTDTGNGMDRETLERIFDPYFTTKEKSRGTGLGLSVVHGIVKKHGGYVTVDSELGRGSTFRVCLPIIRVDEKMPDSCVKPSLLTGDERILVVDDEIRIIAMLKDALEKFGYDITPLGSGIDALEAFRKDPDGFDLMITDLDMPGISGLALAEHMLQIRPGFPIVLCTGFGDMITEEKAKGLGIRKLLLKPLMQNELALAIREVLDF